MGHRLTHLGEPMPLPRPRVRVMSGKDGRPWPKLYLPAKARRRMDEIAAEWRAQRLPCLLGPLVCEIAFAFARPQMQLGTGRNAGVVKPRYLDARPAGADVDNCAKLCLDALQGTAFANDDQIAELHATKLYTDQAAVESPQTIVLLDALSGDLRALKAVA